MESRINQTLKTVLEAWYFVLLFLFYNFSKLNGFKLSKRFSLKKILKTGLKFLIFVRFTTIYHFNKIYMYTYASRMLRAILNKSWRQHPTKHQLYGHLPPIAKTIQVRRTRHAGHCWRSRDEPISYVLLEISTFGRAKVGWPARAYIQQLCEDTGFSPEHLPGAMNDREKWWERVRDIHASGTTWWWWLWWYI